MPLYNIVEGRARENQLYAVTSPLRGFWESQGSHFLKHCCRQIKNWIFNEAKDCMLPNQDLESFSHECFEDEADMLEFAYEKIENSIFIWALWCKTFAPEMSDEVSRSLAIEFLIEIHKQIAPRISIDVGRDETGNILLGFIRKYREKKADPGSNPSC